MHCRLCLKDCSTGDSKLLYGESDEIVNMHLIKLIVKYLYLEIKQNDAYSTKVCQQCAQQLEDFSQYCQYIEQQQAFLCEDIISANLKNSDQNNSVVLNVKSEEIEPDNEANEIVDNWIPNYEDGNVCNVLNEASDDHSSHEALMSDNEIIEKFVKLNCNVCGNSSKTFDDLKNHFRSAHNISQGYAFCCNKRFFHLSKLLEHAKHHQNPDIFKPRTIEELRVHMHQEHKNMKPFSCDICGQKFSLRKSLESHTSSAHTTKCEGEVVVVNAANTEHSDTEVLDANLHLNVVDKTITVSEINIKEEVAFIEDETVRDKSDAVVDPSFGPNQKNSNSSQIENATTINSNQTLTRSCPFCEREFHFRIMLDQHTKTCPLRDKKRKIDFNAETISSSSSEHFQTNTKEAPINGQLIETVWNEPDNAENNTSKSKIDIKYRMCPLCFKEHITLGALRIHMHRWHAGVLPFSCSKCGEKFRLAQTFERHELKCRKRIENKKSKKEHSRPGEEQLNAALHDDLSAEVSFSHQLSPKKDKKSWKQHRNDNTDVKYRTCNLCHSTSATVAGLRTHMNRWHKNVHPFVCLECGEQFRLSQTLERHMVKCMKKAAQDRRIQDFIEENHSSDSEQPLDMAHLLFGSIESQYVSQNEEALGE